MFFGRVEESDSTVTSCARDILKIGGLYTVPEQRLLLPVPTNQTYHPALSTVACGEYLTLIEVLMIPQEDLYRHWVKVLHGSSGEVGWLTYMYGDLQEVTAPT